MNLKAKLTLYFSSIAILMVMVGIAFYIQLKNLIESLTPRSIPHAVEQLAEVIDRNELSSRLMYQQLLVESNIENYIFTGSILSLQEYYKNSSRVYQLLERARALNPAAYPALKNKFDFLTELRSEITSKMQHNNRQASLNFIKSESYSTVVSDFKTALSRYFQHLQTSSNEEATVTVRLAARNSYTILQESLNLTLTILFDAIIASLLLVFFSTRAIVQPINQLRNNIEKMDASKILVNISPKLLKLRGEVGDLARSFSELFQKLRAETVLRDELVTEIHRHMVTEKQLRETASQLQESNLDLDQFAYAASHDLRSPLRAIESLTQWIQEDCYHLLPEGSRKNFDLIKKRVRRLDSLIAGMLDYSRAGRENLPKESVDLNRLMAEITDNLAPPPNIRIIVDNTLPTLMTDRSIMSQIFLNLLSNAIKYNDKAEGIIHVGHAISENYHRFYISDNGCGIDPKFHDKIFEIFQTLQSRDTIESSGIGLAIVKKIIEKNMGKIWLTSELHKGTTFYFLWPAQPAEMEGSEPVSGTGKKIQ